MSGHLPPSTLSPSRENPLPSFGFGGVALYWYRRFLEEELMTKLRGTNLAIRGHMEGRQAAIMIMPPSRMVQMPRSTEVPGSHVRTMNTPENLGGGRTGGVCFGILLEEASHAQNTRYGTPRARLDPSDG